MFDDMTTEDPFDMDRARVDFVENPFSDNPEVDGIAGFISVRPEEREAFERAAERHGVTVEEYMGGVVAAHFAELEAEHTKKDN